MSTETDVIAAVERYVEGVTKANPAIVTDSFAPNAVMWGYLGEAYESISSDTFAKNIVAPSQPAGPEYSHRVHSVVVTGRIASAILDEEGYLGANFRDIFGLVEVDGVWRIASKVFTTV